MKFYLIDVSLTQDPDELLRRLENAEEWERLRAAKTLKALKLKHTSNDAEYWKKRMWREGGSFQLYNVADRFGDGRPPARRGIRSQRLGERF